jgi:phosphoribosylanthranilate isomerase
LDGLAAPAVDRVRVKVCGLTTVADALACAAAGVDWVGLNFHPASPRFIEPARAAEIVAALPPACTPVGLFVDRPPAFVLETAGRVGLRAVQLHGDEPVEDLAALTPRLTVVRAFRLSGAEAFDRMLLDLRRAADLGCPPARVLVDAFAPGQTGGTGRTIAPDFLDRLAALPGLILAGGLNPENVAGFVARVRPWMVDVASGVESSPGRKDPARVAAFIRAARGC